MHDVAVVVRKSHFRLGRCSARQLDSQQQRGYLIVRLHCKSTGVQLAVCTTHLESGICSPQGAGRDLRAAQLEEISAALQKEPGDAVILAGDLNLRPWEARQAKVDDDGGEH